MPDPITPYLGLTQPAVGGDDGTWGGILNGNNDTLDEHDHTVGKGVPVPVAGLDIDDDLSFAGHKATNLAGSVYSPGASPGQHGVWVKLSDGNLYYTDGAGNQIQLTAGGTINITLVGGVTGDYAAVGASLYYDDADKTYRMLQAAPLPNVWASVSCGDLDLYEKASGASTRTRLKAHASLGASYALTFPAALPGSTSLVASDDAGGLAFTRDPSVDTITTSGDATIGGDVEASGHVAGTTLYHSTSDEIVIPVSIAGLPAGVSFLTEDYAELSLSTITNGVIFPVVLPVGCVIKTVTTFINKATNNTHTITAALRKTLGVDGTIADAATGSDAENAVGYTSFGMGALTVDIETGYAYTVKVKGSGTGGDSLLYVRITYTRPHP